MQLWRRYAIVGVGLFESLLFSGCLFGWPYLLHILQQEGVYSHLCLNSTMSPSSTMMTTERSMTTETPYTMSTVENDDTSINEKQTSLDTNYISSRITTRRADYSENDDLNNPLAQRQVQRKMGDCDDQIAQMTLIYTVASISYGLTSILIGFSLDILGLWFTRLGGCILTSGGFFCLIYTTKESSWLLWPALNLIALGTSQLRLSSFQFANCWPNHRTTVLIAYSSAYSVSTVLFLLIQVAYSASISYKSAVSILAGISLLTFPPTFIMPRFRIKDQVEEIKINMVIDDNSKVVRRRPSIMEHYIESKDEEEDDCPRILRKASVESKSLMNPFDEDAIHGDKSRQNAETMEAPLGASLFTLSALLHLFWHFTNFFLVLFYSSTFYPWLKKMTDDKRLIDHYNFISAVCALTAPIFIPLAGLITDWQIRNASKLEDRVERLRLTMQAPASTKAIASLFILGTMVCKIFFSSGAVYISLALIAISRPFIVGSCASYIRLRFHPSHFNRLNGIFTTVVSLLCMIQYPILIWMNKSTEDFVLAQLLLIGLLLASFISPGHMLLNPLARKYANEQLKFRTDI